ncbi:MAG: peptide chain release factor N(5)-glutamine methyltransferase [Anaerolineae bacterium]|jgi:release factor glutamine methyltransferase
MNSGEALAQATTRLRNEGVESPRLDAELLLAHVLDANRAAILARPDQRLTPKQLTRYRDLVSRRAGREPLAYIVGHREFYDLDLVLDRRALIPRPETELLVEHALRIARRMAPEMKPLHIADVGAGSGAIAVTLAVHLPQATVYALDESAGALEVVAENARRCGVADRMRCLHGDLLSPLPEDTPLAMITANLPYVSTAEWLALAPEIRDHEPRAALDGGADGLGLIRRLLATAGSHLRPKGAILIEIGASQGASVTTLARKHFDRASVQLVQDYAGLDRLVVVETAYL